MEFEFCMGLCRELVSLESVIGCCPEFKYLIFFLLMSFVRICGLHCSHVQTTEEGREDGYGDPNGLTRRLPMPGKGSCSNGEKDQEIPQLILGLPI